MRWFWQKPVPRRFIVQVYDAAEQAWHTVADCDTERAALRVYERVLITETLTTCVMWEEAPAALALEGEG